MCIVMTRGWEILWENFFISTHGICIKNIRSKILDADEIRNRMGFSNRITNAVQIRIFIVKILDDEYVKSAAKTTQRWQYITNCRNQINFETRYIEPIIQKSIKWVVLFNYSTFSINIFQCFLIYFFSKKRRREKCKNIVCNRNDFCYMQRTQSSSRPGRVFRNSTIILEQIQTYF